MGWMICNRPRHPKQDLDSNHNHKQYEVLRSAFVGLTYYAAVRNNDTGEVHAAVSLVRYYRNGEWGVKDMDETMGPYESKCPKTILALLTPIDSEQANNWRELCRVYHETRSKR